MPDSFGQLRPFDPADEAKDDSLRDCFEIDFDRVLYSPELRRLAGVTQVISPQADYVFHDRLTHSLKVSQMSARLASYLFRSYKEGGGDATKDELQLNATVCATAGLIHDLGHPPFGHAAEIVMQDILSSGVSVGQYTKRALLKDSFEGNAQSNRSITRLSMRKPRETEQRGLNLTWRTIAAASKYPWTHGNHPRFAPNLESKWGFYNSDSDYLDYLVDNAYLPRSEYGQAIKNLEASVMDWADDIAYAVHDVEDFVRAGRINLHALGWESREDSDDSDWNQLIGQTRKKLSPYFDEDELPSEAEITTIAESYVLPNVPGSPFDGSQSSHAQINEFGSAITSLLQSACSLDDSTPSACALTIQPEARVVAEFLKSTTVIYVINDPVVDTMQRGQSAAIREVFEYLLERSLNTVGDNDSWLKQRSLPPRLREYVRSGLAEAEETGKEAGDEIVARGVVDFVCSLTDKQTSLLHQRITGDHIGSLPPYWLTA